MRELTTLIRNGFPPDFALSLDRAEQMAFCVIVGEQNGGQYNWAKLKWDK